MTYEFDPQGIPVQGVIWRENGHWRLALTGPRWLLSDVADELINKNNLRVTGAGGPFPNGPYDIMFDQTPIPASGPDAEVSEAS